ncbi:MAG: hypothetical protein RL324_2536 [Verrucomicrobiota bacterium]|jgi:hypothetical protein
MKPLRILVLFFSLLAGLRAADAIQVAGVISAGPGKTMIRLVNSTTGVAAWVSVGDTFSGYNVQSYSASSDGKSDSVTLTGNGTQLRLTLATPKIRSSTARGGTTAGPGNAPNDPIISPFAPGAPAGADPTTVQLAAPPPQAPAGN